MSHLEQELCERIYEEYRERLHWYVRKKFDWLKTEDMHDILQETWCELSKKIEEVALYEPSKRFDWLTVVCHNKVVDFIRKQKWVMDEDYEEMEKLMDVKKVISMEDKVIDRLMLEKLLQSLTEEERKILYLSMFAPKKKKRSNAETCKFYRIKQKLRKMWKDGDDDEKE